MIIILPINVGTENTFGTSIPSNNTPILGKDGDVNVMIQCAVFNRDSNEQLITLWTVRRTNSSAIPIDVRVYLALYTEVIYEGTPLRSGSGTYQDRLIIRIFPTVLEGHTIFCGASTIDKSVAQFPVELYSKYQGFSWE